MLLGFVSLTNPLMLGGLALLTLPVAAHLLNRFARRQITFPSIALLQEAVATESQLMRLRRWLLLLLRCLMVMALVAAFTRPVWLESRKAAAQAREGNAVVIVLDVSASMQYQQRGVSLIEAAKGAAHRTLNQLRRGQDVADVVLATREPSAVFNQLSPNLIALADEIQQVRPTFEATDGLAACRLAGRLLGEHQGPRRLVLISDLQTTNWSELLESSAQPTDWLPSGTEVVAVDLNRSSSDNISLAQARCFPRRPLSGQPVEFVVQLHNSASANKQVRVMAEVDGSALPEQLVTLGAGQRSDVAFSSQMERHGRHEVVFRIDKDALNCDNQSFLVAQTVDRLPVTIITDDDPQRVGSGSYFLTHALTPFQDESDRYAVRIIAGRDMSANALASSAAVFVDYLGQLTPAQATILRDYVESGGGVVVFCGEGPVRRNLLALDQLDPNGLLPWLPGPRIDLSQTDGAFIAQGKWRSTLLRDFDEASQISLGQIRFGTVWQAMEVRPQAEVLLSYDNGTPALATRQIGIGQLAVANFSPDVESSDLGKYGAFVALTQMLVKNLRLDDGQAKANYVGRPLMYEIESSTPAANLQVSDPEGHDVQASIAVRNDSVIVQVDQPSLPGIYQIRSGDDVVGAFPVNVDPRESDLQSIPSNQLQQALGQIEGAAAVRATTSWEAAIDLKGRPLWGWLVVFGMAFAATELLLLGWWRR